MTNFIGKKGLKRRGWTNSLMKKFLPINTSITLDLVAEIEESEAFKLAKARSALLVEENKIRSQQRKEDDEALIRFQWEVLSEGLGKFADPDVVIDAFCGLQRMKT
ncbi:MAG: hypothetical protein ACTS2F_27680 [Thainema sp.]